MNLLETEIGAHTMEGILRRRKPKERKAEKLYYKKFEDKKPYQNEPPSLLKVLLFRFFSLILIGIGVSYLYWRWTSSLNPSSLIFSTSLVIAETCMFLGTVLMIINHWSIKNIKQKAPVRFLSEIDPTIPKSKDRPIKIDLLIATYNESLALVEDTIKDAKNLCYRHLDVDCRIFLCDDGKRDGLDPHKENFKQLAKEHQINYLSRKNNKGYKAGNLNNVFWQTDGDLIVILDADTRVFPQFLNNLTGYFRDPKLAWVQSPQWFYDLPEGNTLDKALRNKFPRNGHLISSFIPFSRKIRIGQDIFGTDPRIFYNVILSHRNAANAAFCCGAGSIHRRKALESLILTQTAELESLDSTVNIHRAEIKNHELYTAVGQRTIGPFVHHVSEDIYTSILLHSNSEKWKSYQHPQVECRMLSPQNMPDFTKQYSRYGEGTFDIFFSRNNPILRKGLSIRQKLAYGETFYSYFSSLWIMVFLLSPIIYYFTLTSPISAFSFDFFLRFIMLNIFTQIVITILHWGIPSTRAEQYYIAGFWMKVENLFKSLIGNSISFNTTSKERNAINWKSNLKYVFPHLLIVALTVIGFGYNLYLVMEGVHPSLSAFVANNIWATYNIYQFSPFILGILKK